MVQNPHDPDAQWSAKGQGKQRKDWVGYKVQVAETVASQSDQSSFISSVVTQRASGAMMQGYRQHYKNKKHLASTARRSCTPTALTFQGKRSTKPKERAGS